MRVLKVEFAARKPLPKWLWVGMTLLFSVLALHEAAAAWRLQQRIAQLQREQAELSEKLDAARGAVLIPISLPPYARDAAEMARIAAFPLAQVFASLESAQIEGIRLTNLDVSATEGTVRVELEFASYTALLGYLEVINAGQSEGRWSLLQAQSATAEVSQGSATITSKWAD